MVSSHLLPEERLGSPGLVGSCILEQGVGGACRVYRVGEEGFVGHMEGVGLSGVFGDVLGVL